MRSEYNLVAAEDNDRAALYILCGNADCNSTGMLCFSFCVKVFWINLLLNCNRETPLEFQPRSRCAHSKQLSLEPCVLSFDFVNISCIEKSIQYLTNCVHFVPIYKDRKMTLCICCKCPTRYAELLFRNVLLASIIQVY